MQILIIGSGGQVATHLRKQAQALNLKVTQLSSHQMNLENNDLVISALENFDKGATSNEPKIIINAAAYTNVEQAENEYEKAMQINAHAPKLIAEFAKTHGYLLIHYSTDYVFDGTEIGEYHENDNTSPINKYGMSKLLGEKNIINSGCNYLVLRTSWVFSGIGINFVKKMAELLQIKDELKVIDDQIGRPSSAGFIADITYHLLKHYKNANVKEIINICQPETTSWYGFASEIKTLLEAKSLKCANLIPITANEYPTKAERPKNSVLSLDKLNQVLPDYKIASWKSDLVKVVEDLALKS